LTNARIRTGFNACEATDAPVLDAMIPMAYKQRSAVVVHVAAVDQGASSRQSGVGIGCSLKTYKFTKMIGVKLQFIFGLWHSEPMPQQFVDNLETWKRSLPQLSIHGWNRFECYQLLDKYKELTWVLQLRPVQQAEVVRLLIIYREGGWYNYLDTRPLRDGASMWKSCSEEHMVVVTESICDTEATQMTLP
jgi:hypothetical protein